MTVIIFGLGDKVRALESTPEYCFKYSAYPTEDCYEVIECSEIDGEKMCTSFCEGSGIYVDFYIEDYLCYDGNDKGYETITDVVIPTIFDNWDLTKINHHMSIDGFQNKNLTSVIIPDVVNKIEEGSFYNNELVELMIPSSITEIGKLSFANNNITKVINKSNIDNSILKDNIGRSNQNYLIFGTSCSKSEDGITTCLGEKNINISNTEIVDDDKPSNGDKYEEIEKNPNDEQDSSLENNADNNIIDNPKTLDSNMQIFVLVVIFSLIVIISMLLKVKKSKYTKNSN